MTRKHLIEQILRQVYGGHPSDDSSITEGLVNQYITQGTALAAKQNYKENYQIEGVGFVNNSFYSTFKGIAITADERNLYKFTLPTLPLGIGSVDGISRVVLKNSDNEISYPVILISESQVGMQRSMRQVQNKLIGYPEGGYCYLITPLIVTSYTASVTLISGGDDTDLNSTLNVPNDYINTIVEYCKTQLSFERNMPVNAANDGMDAIRNN